MTARRTVHRLNLPAWLVILALLALWELVSATAGLDYLPEPIEVGEELGRLISSGDIAGPLGHTLSTTVVAAAIACAIGLLTGLAVGLVPLVRTYLMASIDVLRTVPVIALMPVALLIWGPAVKTEIIVATYAAVWPMLINAVGGTEAAHSGLREVARMFGLGRWETVWKIVVPAGTPQFVVGARLAIVTALIVAVVAEMIVSSSGLGWEIVQAQAALRPARMWAFVVVTAFLGYALNVVLMAAARLASPGGRASAEVLR